MLWFLHEKYFPCVAWAQIILNPSKSEFFVDRIKPLGMLVGRHKTSDDGVVYSFKAGNQKKDKIVNYPIPTSLEEIENFLYLTIYLKALIPGYTEHARILKEAVVRAPDVNIKQIPDGNKKKKSKAIIGFNWGQDQ